MAPTILHTICSKMPITEQNRAEHHVTSSTTGTELRKSKGIQSVTAHSLRTCIKHFPKDPHCTFLHPAVGMMLCSTDPTLGLFFLPLTVSSLHSTYRTVKQRKEQCFYLTQPEIRQSATYVSWVHFTHP